MYSFSSITPCITCQLQQNKYSLWIVYVQFYGEFFLAPYILSAIVSRVFGSRRCPAESCKLTHTLSNHIHGHKPIALRVVRYISRLGNHPRCDILPLQQRGTRLHQ